MIIKSLVCPGPEWKPLPVTFVVSELTGQRTEIKATEFFWLWEPVC